MMKQRRLIAMKVRTEEMTMSLRQFQGWPALELQGNGLIAAYLHHQCFGGCFDSAGDTRKTAQAGSNAFLKGHIEHKWRIFAHCQRITVLRVNQDNQCKKDEHNKTVKIRLKVYNKRG